MLKPANVFQWLELEGFEPMVEGMLHEYLGVIELCSISVEWVLPDCTHIITHSNETEKGDNIWNVNK